MSRNRRLKIENAEVWYHVSARASALKGEYPLAKPMMAEKLQSLIEFYTSVYFCSTAAFNILGNHYHLNVRFDRPREVDRGDLERRAAMIYPGKAGLRKVASWTDEDWQKFRDRLFNLSELMRNVQGIFATWYNRTLGRRGRFWAERFKSVILGDERAVLDCILYVELNAVRAGLVIRPEDWRQSSLHHREIGKLEWLMPLTEVLSCASGSEALVAYRSLVYHRGAVPTKPGQASISPELLEQEAARGFATSGTFRRRFRHFSEGVAIGSRTMIVELLGDLRKSGQYLRRRHPISKLGGLHHVLREQRRQRSPT
jgi:hypothetical protein